MGKINLDERKLTALGGQLKKKFNCVAHEVKVVATGGRKFKVSVGGGNLGGFHLAMTVNGWLEGMGFDVNYAGRIPGRLGSHVLEVRS